MEPSATAPRRCAGRTQQRGPFSWAAAALAAMAALLLLGASVGAGRALHSASGLLPSLDVAAQGQGGAARGGLEDGAGARATHARSLLEDKGKDKGSSDSGDGKKQKPYDTCVCVFDFDETLRVISWDGKNHDEPAKDGAGIVRRCKNNGWEVGIASANDNYAKLEKVLGQKIAPDVFTPEFFNSSAFQYHWFNKTISLDAIARYYDTWPKCMILFDDMEHNRKYADNIGTPFEKVQNDTGVQWYNYEDAKRRVWDNCDCAKPQERSFSAFSFQPPDRSFAGRDRMGRPLASATSAAPASQDEEREVSSDFRDDGSADASAASAAVAAVKRLQAVGTPAPAPASAPAAPVASAAPPPPKAAAAATAAAAAASGSKPAAAVAPAPAPAARSEPPAVVAVAPAAAPASAPSTRTAVVQPVAIATPGAGAPAAVVPVTTLPAAAVPTATPARRMPTVATTAAGTNEDDVTAGAAETTDPATVTTYYAPAATDSVASVDAALGPQPLVAADPAVTVQSALPPMAPARPAPASRVAVTAPAAPEPTVARPAPNPAAAKAAPAAGAKGSAQPSAQGPGASAAPAGDTGEDGSDGELSVAAPPGSGWVYQPSDTPGVPGRFTRFPAPTRKAQ